MLAAARSPLPAPPRNNLTPRHVCLYSSNPLFRIAARRPVRYTGCGDDPCRHRPTLMSATSHPVDPAAELRARFEAVVMPHLDRLLAFAIRRTDSVADAEDAVQEACVRAWLGFTDLRDEANARPWFYRILRTVLSDMREKSGRRQQLVYITRLEDAHDELVGGEHDALFAEVVSRLDGEAVHRGLRNIPEDFAAAVELHDIDGFKYVEIAEIVGVPIGTVMSRIARGRKLLAGAIMAERGAAASELRNTDRRSAQGGPR
jgi:RNA polymerase sigma-70 factor, ECF subfamily